MDIPASIAAITPDGQLKAAQRRRLMIKIAERRIKPGTGSGYEFLHRRTAMNPWPDLRPILQDLPWVVVGGVATRAYMPERATKDLDIMVHQRDGQAAIELLETAGYQLISSLAIPGYLLQSPDGVEVDVVFADYPWLDQALAASRQDPAGYPILNLPYLILTKLEASRVQDLGDLSRMLGLASEPDLDRVRAVVSEHAPDAVEDLETLIYLGQMEMKPPPTDT